MGFSYDFIKTYDLREVLVTTGLLPSVYFCRLRDGGGKLKDELLEHLEIKVARTVDNIVLGETVLSLVYDYSSGEKMLLIHNPSPYQGKFPKFRGSKAHALLCEMVRPPVRKSFIEWLKSI